MSIYVFPKETILPEDPPDVVAIKEKGNAWVDKHYGRNGCIRTVDKVNPSTYNQGLAKHE